MLLILGLKKIVMKKVLILFYVFSSILCMAQTRNIGVGILVDGRQIITDSDEKLTMEDIMWSLKMLKNDCVVKGEECVFLPWIDDYNINQWMICFDLNELTFPCGSWSVGDEIEISVEVINANHPLVGYKGSMKFAAPQIDRDYWDEEGVNLVKTGK